MEKCIFKHLYNFILTNDILTPHQSGFRPNDSTVNQLLSITSDFYKAVDRSANTNSFGRMDIYSDFILYS